LETKSIVTYCIRRKKDNKLSKGPKMGNSYNYSDKSSYYSGKKPEFTKFNDRAKIWDNIGHLHRHLMGKNIVKYYDGCEILIVTVDYASKVAKIESEEIIPHMMLVKL
jgi:hypothetical protein